MECKIKEEKIRHKGQENPFTSCPGIMVPRLGFSHILFLYLFLFLFGGESYGDVFIDIPVDTSTSIVKVKYQHRYTKEGTSWACINFKGQEEVKIQQVVRISEVLNSWNLKYDVLDEGKTLKYYFKQSLMKGYEFHVESVFYLYLGNNIYTDKNGDIVLKYYTGEDAYITLPHKYQFNSCNFAVTSSIQNKKTVIKIPNPQGKPFTIRISPYAG